MISEFLSSIDLHFHEIEMAKMKNALSLDDNYWKLRSLSFIRKAIFILNAMNAKQLQKPRSLIHTHSRIIHAVQCRLSVDIIVNLKIQVYLCDEMQTNKLMSNEILCLYAKYEL